MNDRDLLILTVYLICVVYVFYRAINSIDDQMKIQLDQESLDQQIEAQNLQDLVSIKFDLKKKYEFDQFKELPISITNKSAEQLIGINWDYCSVTNLDGRSRRVIRLLPGTTLDLMQSQASSTIAPGKTLKENLIAEDALKRESDAGALKVVSPLIDVTQIAKKDKKLYANFLAATATLQFSLKLVLRQLDPFVGGDRTYLLSCQFNITKVPWTAEMPWNK